MVMIIPGPYLGYMGVTSLDHCQTLSLVRELFFFFFGQVRMSYHYSIYYTTIEDTARHTYTSVRLGRWGLFETTTRTLQDIRATATGKYTILRNYKGS